MITFTQFGKLGRLGNQLFQYASLIGFAHKYKTEIALPAWNVASAFKHAIPTMKGIKPTEYIKEPYYHYTPVYWDLQADLFKGNVVDIEGWLQSENYWLHCVDRVMDALTFTQEIINRVSHMEYKNRVAIIVRRGDYVDNPNYELLPAEYYKGAHQFHFKGKKAIVFSDDIPYCQAHKIGGDGAIYVTGFTPIEQMCLLSLCTDFIISNSTFAWWGAYLGEVNGGKVVRPNYLFKGQMKMLNDEKDFYPARWIVYEHKVTGKRDLSDTTFIIPVYCDSIERQENLACCVAWLQANFETNIIIGENNGSNFGNYTNIGCGYMQFNYPEFHRTRMLNQLTLAAKTPYVFNWDCDVVCQPDNLYESVEKLRAGLDFVYPYDGRFARVPRHDFKAFVKSFDFNVLVGKNYYGLDLQKHGASVGGAIGYNKEKFIEAGGENEEFVSYGPEDAERSYRFRMLGYNVARTYGVLYHFDHPITLHSSNKHAHASKNQRLWEKIQRMSKEELQAYKTKISQLYENTTIRQQQ